MMNNKKYSDIVNKALDMIKESSDVTHQSVQRNHSGIHPDILNAIKMRKTSIGNHPALPSGGARSFDYALVVDRYNRILNSCKSAFDSDIIDESEENINHTMSGLLFDCMETERPNRHKLEELAKKMIMDEYGLTEDSIVIEANLVDRLSMGNSIEREYSDESHIMEFEKYSDIEGAEGEIMKRRLINAMVQGCANGHNHMYHMVGDELDEISPTLVNRYKKITSMNDLMYFKRLKPESAKSAGVVSVSYDDDGRGRIKAEAMIFPVLIHELIKGCMELIAAHGFTSDDKLNEFVVSQADFTAAEPWDLRVGPGLWGKFMESIPAEKVNMKSHVFYEMVKLPVNKFNATMKEIFAGTREGKRVVEDIIKKYETSMERERIKEMRDTKTSEETTRSIDDINRMLDSGVVDML